MQKKLLCFVLSLAAVCCWADASPVKLDTLEFDKLDADLDDLKYEVEKEVLTDYSKLIDDSDEEDSDKDKFSVNGFKKKHALSKGLKKKHDIGDVKKFYKTAGEKERGRYNDDDVYAAIKALAAEAVGVKGTEERKYRKGTKTRGFHKVHHKDEYKKNKEFYDDDQTAGVIKKVGGKTVGYKIGGGAKFNKGHFKHDHNRGSYGNEGFWDKGFLNEKYNGFSDEEGFEETVNEDS